MKAVIWPRYGPPEVLRVEEIEQPTPNDDEFLVEVSASNVFPGDCEFRRLDLGWVSVPLRLYSGFLKPRSGVRLGQEFAGRVVAAGSAATRFKPGDRVFGAVDNFLRGSNAEYLTTSGKYVTTIPDNVSDEAAACATVGGLNALEFLRVAGSPKKILLVGAGGSIGTMAVQLARAFGSHVTAVDTTHKLERLRELGADEVIDYTREDFASRGPIYDAVIDIVGKNVARRIPLSHTLKAVKPGGYLILGNPSFLDLLARVGRGLFSNRKIRFVLAGYSRDKLETLRELMATGRVTPVIDRRFPMAEVVEAHRYVESGRRIGNVVMTM